LSRLPFRFPFLPRSPTSAGRAIDFTFILGGSLALLASKHRKGRGRVAALAARLQIPMLYLEGTRESRFNRPAKAPAMRKGLADPRVQRAYYTPSATEMIISGCAFGMRNVIPTRGDPNSLAHSPRTALARLEPVIIIASLPLPLDLRVRLQVGGIRVSLERLPSAIRRNSRFADSWKRTRSPPHHALPLLPLSIRTGAKRESTPRLAPKLRHSSIISVPFRS